VAEDLLVFYKSGKDVVSIEGEQNIFGIWFKINQAIDGYKYTSLKCEQERYELATFTMVKINTSA
jgi:hypothetical protein